MTKIILCKIGIKIQEESKWIQFSKRWNKMEAYDDTGKNRKQMSFYSSDGT